MFQVVKSVVSRVVSCRAAVTGALVAAVMALPCLVFAQTSQPITLTVPDVDYASVATQLMTALVPVVLAAIGIGLSIWCIVLLYRLFRNIGK
jgi:hypothetical protein